MYPKVAGTAIPHTHTLPLSSSEVMTQLGVVTLSLDHGEHVEF